MVSNIDIFLHFFCLFYLLAALYGMWDLSFLIRNQIQVPLHWQCIVLTMGCSWWLVGRESTCDARQLGSVPGWGRSPGGGHGNPFIFFPGKSHGQRSLVGYRP